MITSFNSIPEYPSSFNGTTALVRLIDGLGFRYHWSTEGLTETDFEFRPHPSSMNMSELLKHIYDLSFWLRRTFVGKFDYEKPINSFDHVNLTRNNLVATRNHLLGMSDEDLAQITINIRWSESPFPIWNTINGPIADALTHVGQITSWRRIHGNPQFKGVNVFEGKPPKSDK